MSHYNIYPSLMDAYCYMRNVEGDEETIRQAEQDFLDTVNRVERDPNYYTARGTALNELVDARACHVAGQHPVKYRNEGDAGGVFTVDIDTFLIDFSEALVEQAAAWVEGMTPQVYVEADIIIPQGTVCLYGYADYVGIEEVVDLKSTKKYSPDNRDYSEHWQHRVYPYCLVKSGMCQSADRFTYLVAECNANKEGVVDGQLYRESYEVSIVECTRQLHDFLGYELIPWLEEHRQQITNDKIFND